MGARATGGKSPRRYVQSRFWGNTATPPSGPSESQGFRGSQVPLFGGDPHPTTTLAQAKAERRRQQLLDAAVHRWKKAVKELGLNGTAYRSGMRAIEASSRPGQAVNGLIRAYRGRKVQASETTPLADLSDFQILKVKLYRSRGGGWFPSTRNGCSCAVSSAALPLVKLPPMRSRRWRSRSRPWQRRIQSTCSGTKGAALAGAMSAIRSRRAPAPDT